MENLCFTLLKPSLLLVCSFLEQRMSVNICKQTNWNCVHHQVGAYVTVRTELPTAEQTKIPTKIPTCWLQRSCYYFTFLSMPVRAVSITLQRF